MIKFSIMRNNQECIDVTVLENGYIKIVVYSRGIPIGYVTLTKKEWDEIKEKLEEQL